MMLLERKESLFRDNSRQIIDFYKLCLKGIKQLSYKGQSLTLAFAQKMISHVGLAEAGLGLSGGQKQQQVELVSIALDVQLVHHGSITNGLIARKAVVKFFRELLKSKNILVLQEAYAALTRPLKASVEALSCTNPPGKKN